MSTIFYRLHADRTRTDVALEDVYAGPTRSACWLIGGGPSLARLPHAAISASPVPKMCVNLSGSRLLRPTFWTSYDPSLRFHRSVYLDPGIVKFIHRRRAMDLVPETTYKVCDCPNTFFFDRDGDRGFADFLAPECRAIVDWADSLVQAVDILYRLGFRVIYLAGCEMRVRPSNEQTARAAALGVEYTDRLLLQDFLRECTQAGLTADELDGLSPGPHYHFGEHKPLRSAANTDLHYFRVAQYLRLSRRSLSLAGVELISVTPGSRLNDYFPYVSVRSVLRQIAREIGDPKTEPLCGLYRQTVPRQSSALGPMRDYRPHHRKPDHAVNRQNGRTPHAAGSKIVDGELIVEAEGFQRLAAPPGANGHDAAHRLQAKLQHLPERLANPRERG